jgi:hypothetical protein
MTFTQSFKTANGVNGGDLESERAPGIDRSEQAVCADLMTNLLDAMRTVEVEIVAAEREFERSIAELYGKREKLSRDYAELLKTELARVEANGGGVSRARAPRRDAAPMPDGDVVLAVLERAGVGLATAQIRELAGIPRAVPYGSMSDLMRQLVNDGRVVREGRSSGTRYRIR